MSTASAPPHQHAHRSRRQGRRLGLGGVAALAAIAAWLLASAPAAGAEAEEPARPAFLAPPDPLPTSVAVPPEVLSVVQTAEAEADPQRALVLLQAYQGKPSALIALLIGQESMQLAALQGRTGTASDRLAQAEAAFHQAQALDPQLRQARLGLAEVAAERGDWQKTLALAGPAIDPAVSSQLQAYGVYACRAQDWELAGAVATLAIMRFPEDPGIRQLHLSVLLHARRFGEAAETLQARLDQRPGQPALWRDLAYCLQELGEGDRALTALEAATIAAPHDADLRRHLCEAQLEHGMPQAALATVQGLLAEPLKATPVPVLELAARIAAEAGDLAQARRTMAAVPPAGRTRESVRLSAQLDLDAGDQAAAAAAVSELISLGEHDPGVLAWAGTIAERQGENARAEALYQEAIAGSGPQAAAAQLRLAVLLDREGRIDEALTQVATYLARHPGDRDATTLQTLISAHRSEQASGASPTPTRPAP